MCGGNECLGQMSARVGRKCIFAVANDRIMDWKWGLIGLGS